MYYKIVANGYITLFGEGKGGTEISEAEYHSLKNAMATRPAAEPGYDYRLKEDLAWELYKLPEQPSEEPEPMTETEQKARAFDILMGVGE